MKPIEDEKVVLFYSDKYTRRDTIKLINATGENLVVLGWKIYITI